jgi:hypothetical protein
MIKTFGYELDMDIHKTFGYELLTSFQSSKIIFQ